MSVVICWVNQTPKFISYYITRHGDVEVLGASQSSAGKRQQCFPLVFYGAECLLRMDTA